MATQNRFMNKKFIFSLAALAALFAAFYLSFTASQNIKLSKPVIKLNDISLTVDQAVTPEEQELGLSGRKSLEEDEAMLFPFKESEKHYFWMKDMKFPIDMIFMDKDLKVVYIKKNALPESYPSVYGGEVDSEYVLEVAAGISDKANLKIGDTALLNFPE
jgi:uncharacterized membrane protein (UPF0127 family)